MDFFTTNDGPVEIRIDGKPYLLQRFLNPAMKVWAASIRRQTMDEATAHLDADAKARFINYFQPPAIDIVDMGQRARSPDGAEYVCNEQMKAAGVPDDVRKAMLANAQPESLAALADELATARRTIVATAGDTTGADPLASPPPASGGSPTTTPETTRGSDTPTPAATATA